MCVVIVKEAYGNVKETYGNVKEAYTLVCVCGDGDSIGRVVQGVWYECGYKVCCMCVV